MPAKKVTITIGEGEALALKAAYLLGRDDCVNGVRTDGSGVVSRVMQRLRDVPDENSDRE